MTDGSELFSVTHNCQNCTSGELSLAYCRECKRQLCNECHRQHKKQVDTAQHKTVESPEAEEIRKKYQCPEHPGESLDYYCSDCTRPACDYCFKTRCKDHRCAVKHDVEKEIRTHLNEVKQRKKDFVSHVEHISAVSQQNTDAITFCEGEVDHAIDQLIEKLKEQKELFHKQLQEKSTKDENRVNEQLEYVQGKLEKIRHNIESTEKLLNSRSAARLMVHRDSAIANLTGVAQYSWNTSKVTPVAWQLKNRPADEIVSGFGKLIPKPKKEDIIVEGLDSYPRVGFTNVFTITVLPSCQYDDCDATDEVSVKISQKPYKTEKRDDITSLIQSIRKKSANVWSVSYFLRKHGEILIDVSVCSVSAAGSPFKLQTIENREIAVGTKVVRGPDWKWGNQDGGEGCIGVVVKLKGNGWVDVKWENQKKPTDCRWGADDSYDLKVVS